MKNPKVRQVVLPLITALIWGSAFVTQSLSAAHLGCFSFNALRAIPAVLVLLVLLAVMQRIHPREKYSAEEKRALLRGGLVCGAFLALAINLQQFGMGTTSAGKAGFITALYIVLVPVFSTVLGKKAKKSIWFCVIAAVAGLYFLCFDGSSTLSFSSGDMYVFLSAFAFTAQILAVDYFVQQVDGIALSCAQFAVVIMLSAIGALAFGEHTTLEAVKTHPLRGYFVQRRGLYAADPCAEGRRPDGRVAAAEPRVVFCRCLRRDRPARAHEPARVFRLRADACGGHPLAAAGEKRQSG